MSIGEEEDYQEITLEIKVIRNFCSIENGEHIMVVYSSSLKPIKSSTGYYSKFIKLEFKGGSTIVDSAKQKIQIHTSEPEPWPIDTTIQFQINTKLAVESGKQEYTNIGS